MLEVIGHLVRDVAFAAREAGKSVEIFPAELAQRRQRGVALRRIEAETPCPLDELIEGRELSCAKYLRMTRQYLFDEGGARSRHSHDEYRHRILAICRRVRGRASALLEKPGREGRA